MRLIDADALVESIVRRLDIKTEEYLTAQESVIVSEIYNAPTIEPMEWTPCSEGLPKKYTSVLTTSKNGRVRENFINACGWSYDTYAVVAWMPLPKPYKEGKCSSK